MVSNLGALVGSELGSGQGHRGWACMARARTGGRAERRQQAAEQAGGSGLARGRPAGSSAERRPPTRLPLQR